MKKLIRLLIAVCPAINLHAQAPATPKKPVVDTYFGMQVTDNYRWLEDTKDSTVQKWFKTRLITLIALLIKFQVAIAW